MKELKQTGEMGELVGFFSAKAPELWKSTDKLFLACSGGMDSVVLGHLLKTSGYAFEILHVNFQLRADESDRDEQFVTALAADWNAGIRINRFDTNAFAAKWGKGIQETARKLRYDWFDAVLNEDPAHRKWLLTAHHADDQVETITMNFFRGTGVAGLRGMRELSGNRIKPLLTVFQDRLRQHASLHQLKWVEDSSNMSAYYTRNRFRLEILPQVETLFPSFRQNIIDNAQRMVEVESICLATLDKIKQKLLVKQGDSHAIPVQLLMKQQPLDTVMHHLFTPFGFSAAQVPELKKLFEASTGKYISSATHRVLRNRNWLLIDTLQERSSSIVVIQKAQSSAESPQGTLQIDAHEGPPDKDPMHAFVDANQLEYPLILRPWKTGDYFYPLGMRKKKKLSRFMTDLKLSRSEKEKQWVLESNKKIVWVIGRRIDDRFKVVSSDKPSLKISFSPNP